jgi:hypothetical protein
MSDSNLGLPVWGRIGISSLQCPKTVITPESLFFLEQFHIWKKFGAGEVLRANARVVEALVLLDEEWQKEVRRQKQQENTL